MTSRNLVRASLDPGRVEIVRSAGGGRPLMKGHFLVWDTWTEINSWYEGRFLERISRGSLKKSIRENRSRIRCMYEHGLDWAIDGKPLGRIVTLAEDEVGGYAEVELVDAAHVRDYVQPMLEAGLLGASFRANVLKEVWDKQPAKSDHNPDGLPECTIKELRLWEFGPVVVGAYDDPGFTVEELADDEAARAVSDPRGWLMDRQLARLLRDPRAAGRARQLVSRITPESDPVPGDGDDGHDPAAGTPPDAGEAAEIEVEPPEGTPAEQAPNGPNLSERRMRALSLRSIPSA